MPTGATGTLTDAPPKKAKQLASCWPHPPPDTRRLKRPRILPRRRAAKAMTAPPTTPKQPLRMRRKKRKPAWLSQFSVSALVILLAVLIQTVQPRLKKRARGAGKKRKRIPVHSPIPPDILLDSQPDETSPFITLDEDRDLEEMALLQKDSHRVDHADEIRSRHIEEVSPELNGWLRNTTTPRDEKVPDWRKKVLEYYDDRHEISGRSKHERGIFHLPEYLKKNDVSAKQELPKIYLCEKRKRPEGELPCCIGKNTECFTDGGCFCDESCQNYDDCCPDYSNTCAEILSLCLTTQPPPPTGAPKGAPKPFDPNALKNANDNTNNLPRPPKGGSQPVRLEPNKCCGQMAYNDGENCCCSGELVSAACDLDPCN